jgi:hypothetical protein
MTRAGAALAFSSGLTSSAAVRMISNVIKKNIGIIIENDIINFIKEIKENYSISLITNNDTDKIINIFSQNINNFIKINKITKLDNEIYDLVK